jgi:NTP pyrophosphatase (non-canonical NTP hydrolase)
MTDVEKLQAIAREFIDRRDWRKFHTIKDLAMNCSIESNELMELLLWRDSNFERNVMEGNDNKSLEMIKNEVSDILFSCLAIADHLNFSLVDAYEHKMKELDKRYDIRKVKGKLVKVHSLDNKKTGED